MPISFFLSRPCLWSIDTLREKSEKREGALAQVARFKCPNPAYRLRIQILGSWENDSFPLRVSRRLLVLLLLGAITGMRHGILRPWAVTREGQWECDKERGGYCYSRREDGEQYQHSETRWPVSYVHTATSTLIRVLVNTRQTQKGAATLVVGFISTRSTHLRRNGNLLLAPNQLRPWHAKRV
ncbi:hypothetical protein HDV57DRAFT_22069 [Trichoderma longibrachiatum]